MSHEHWRRWPPRRAPKRPTAPGGRVESRELWRVISADGSTRLFETAASVPAPTGRSAKAAGGDAPAIAGAAKPMASGERRGRMVTPLRRETGHDEKVRLADLFDAAAARQSAAVAVVQRPEAIVVADVQPAPVQDRTPNVANSQASARPSGEMAPRIDAAPKPADVPADADLRQTIDAWPILSTAIRSAILALVRTTLAERSTVA